MFFFQYIYRYISIYIHIYISIYMYILKKERNILRSFAKEPNVLAFFQVLCKRTLHSLCCFTFFAKEHCILCILFRSLEKGRKEHSILLGLISRQKLEKRMLRFLKEWKRTECSERKRTRCPTLPREEPRLFAFSTLAGCNLPNSSSIVHNLLVCYSLFKKLQKGRYQVFLRIFFCSKYIHTQYRHYT